MSLLLVEDDLLIRMDLERRLKKLGVAIAATSATGADAVTLARTHKPTIILMDIKLKDSMSGIDAADQISEFLTCSIVFISAYENQKPGERLAGSDCKVGYYSKPLSDEMLQKILAEFNIHYPEA